MKRPGRKLLLTGAGQCNLTRREDPPAFLDHYGGKGAQGRFLKRALYAFPPESLVRFLKTGVSPCWITARGSSFPGAVGPPMCWNLFFPRDGFGEWRFSRAGE